MLGRARKDTGNITANIVIPLYKSMMQAHHRILVANFVLLRKNLERGAEKGN